MEKKTLMQAIAEGKAGIIRTLGLTVRTPFGTTGWATTRCRTTSCR